MVDGADEQVVRAEWEVSRMGTAPDYAVVILTWNSRRHVEACLTSLREAAPGRSAQLIVIDNGSEDGTPDLVRTCAPEAELIRNDANRGVAPARNQGLERVRAPVAIVLDVDTVVEPNALGRLLDYLDAEPSVGLCGPRLVLPDGGVQPSCQLFPTLRDKLARQLPRRLGESFLREVELASFDHRGTRDVDYVVGACQVIRMSALRAIGGLDDRIFYGPEDVDLCLRLQLAGWRVVFVGEALVHHECQRVTRWRLGKLAWRHLGGLLHFYRTHGYLWSREGLYRRIAAARRLGMGEGTWSSAG
ncbi:MAG: glycosyltransferase family 2 protein [Deltaproteobacteria bacterium]|nr:glycosyltransferase family 2 protein [Deltaproteobacteria bacterium]